MWDGVGFPNAGPGSALTMTTGPLTVSPLAGTIPVNRIPKEPHNDTGADNFKSVSPVVAPLDVAP
jgi:hypothetical protein